jgi:hypothetical protein
MRGDVVKYTTFFGMAYTRIPPETESLTTDDTIVSPNQLHRKKARFLDTVGETVECTVNYSLQLVSVLISGKNERRPATKKYIHESLSELTLIPKRRMHGSFH